MPNPTDALIAAVDRLLALWEAEDWDGLGEAVTDLQRARAQMVPVTRRGATLVLMAVLLSGALLALAAGIQLGAVFVLRAELQRAADAVALAGASGFIDGPGTGDTVRARAQEYAALNTVGGQPVVLEVLEIYPDSAALRIVTGFWTDALLIAPHGLHLRAQAVARARLSNGTGASGKPIPKGNAWGWFRNDEKKAAGTDSARVVLVR